ncbi:hypothetical protein, partial [Bradyrhizobium sp. SZCCHNR1083]|uniref:hypothetical protein n=1 Tax=Bradyrhizobium sp. SZCCHNR1083 TaxID=3057364 RepID=UPI0028F034D1
QVAAGSEVADGLLQLSSQLGRAQWHFRSDVRALPCRNGMAQRSDQELIRTAALAHRSSDIVSS